MQKKSTTHYSTPKQAILPLFVSDFLNISDPVLVFERFLEEINEELACTGVRVETNAEYVPEYLEDVLASYKNVWNIDEEKFVHGRGHRKTPQQRHYEMLSAYAAKLREYVEKIATCGDDCQGCPYAEKCKRTDKNRTIRLNEELTSMHQEVIDNLESIHGALLRMNRSIQAEGTFGIMKQDRRYKRIARKGMKRVLLEIFLVSIGHNLYKYYNKHMRMKKAA